MMISNVYQAITLIFIIIFLIIFSFTPEIFLNQIIIPLIHLLDLSEKSEKILNFFSGSFSKLSNTYNLIFYILFICIISFCIFWFSNYRKNGSLFLFFAIILYPVANIFIDTVWIRRSLFLVLMMPTVPRIWYSFLFLISLIGGGRYYKNILKSLAGISIAIFILPGFYLPPFFDGISGWYYTNKKPLSYKSNSIRIKFSNNTYVWFKPSFFNPLTMANRPERLILSRDKDFYNSDKFYYFLLSLYNKSYPSLKEGRLPTQKNLGSLAYYPHNTDRFDAREIYLPASEVVAFEYVSIDKNSNDRSEEIIKKWSLNVQ